MIFAERATHEISSTELGITMKISFVNSVMGARFRAAVVREKWRDERAPVEN